MPRIPRLSVPGVPLHIVQPGNNRQAVFFQEKGYIAWLGTLFESAIRYEVSVHAWVCMTNHVHRQIHCPNSISRDRLGPKPRDRCGPSPGLRLSRRFSPPGCRLTGASGCSARARHVDFSPNFDQQFLLASGNW